MTRRESPGAAPSAPRVSIIMVNWNNLPDTQACLASLAQVVYPNFEVIVVDNGSSGNDAAVLQQASGHFARIICRRENGGFSEANNEAIKLVLKEGTSCFVLLLNNDTVVEPSFLTSLVAAMSDRGVAIASPVIYHYTKEGPSDKIWYAGAFINYWRGNPRHLVEPPFEPEPTVWASGCAMLVRTSALRQAGLLDEAYFAYFEDVDFCLRMREFGYRGVVVPAARIWHKAFGSVGDSLAPLPVYLRARNRLLFMRRHARPWHYLAFAPYHVYRYALSPLLTFVVTGRRQAVRALLVGLWDGLVGHVGAPPSWLLASATKGPLSPKASLPKERHE